MWYSCKATEIQTMQLQDILYTQGFGTRRVCAGLIQQGLVKVYQADTAEVITDVTTDMEATGLRYQVQGVDWEYHALAYIVFNKPAGTECSQKPSVHPSIYTLLPSPLRLRPQKSAIQGVQAVGRLDQDTTGLLLLSDDGQFIHRMSSPKKHIAKVYEVTTKPARFFDTKEEAESEVENIISQGMVTREELVIHPLWIAE